MSTKRSKNRSKLTFIVIILSLIVLFFLIFQFVIASGGFTWIIDPEIWAYFGTVLGSILIILTLLIQMLNFRAQQIENIFFQMVQYYRDNIAEMQITDPYSPDKTDVVKGRMVFKSIYKQCNSALRILEALYLEKQNIKSFNLKNITTGEEIEYKYNPDIITKFLNDKEPDWLKNNEEALRSYLQKKLWEEQEEKTSKNEVRENIKKKINDIILYRRFYLVLNEIAAQIVYWGVPDRISQDLENNLSHYNKKIIGRIINITKVIPAYQNENIYEIKWKEYKDFDRKGLCYCVKNFRNMQDYPVTFFRGYQNVLGHYLRHVYQTVQYVDSQPSWLLSKEKKKEYIKLLRAQMSNYEQAILFMSSLSGRGKRWEYDNIRQNKYITKYRMIMNVPENFVKGMNPKWYYPDIIFEFENPTQKKEKTMFST